MKAFEIKLTNLKGDQCLKANVYRERIFSLDTNLSELGGPGVNYLSKSLMQFSMQMPNKKIIERIMYENQYVFRTPESISNKMSKDWPVNQAFIDLGNYDVRCTLRWLIKELYKLGELLPLKDILSKAPPLIIKLLPDNKNTMDPGEMIQYEIRTVCKAEINWWCSSNEEVKQLEEPIRVDACSIQTVTYRTKKDSEGWFYIVVSYLDMLHEKSERIYVGVVESDNFREAYAEINGSETTKRIALLIGIMHYDNVKKLAAPKHDIAELDPILRKIGFTVFSFADLNLKQLKHVLNVFSERYLDSNAYVFFYFAGHGMSENKKDFVMLSDITAKLEIMEILNILNVKKPKVLLAMFDMCRNDVNNKSTEKMNIVEANIPLSDNIMLVMSAFPLERAFEKQKKYESHSLIMKALCHCLLNYACRVHINIAFSHFVNDPSITEQKPVIYSAGMPFILGKNDICVPTFKLGMKWQCANIDLAFNFDVFHNKLYVSLDADSKDVFGSNDLGSGKDVKNMNVNIFNLRQKFDKDNSLTFKVYRDGQTEIPFRVIFPQEIVNFF